MIFNTQESELARFNLWLLSADCPDDLGGEAESGFVCGFDKGLKGFLKVFMAFQISEILFFYSKGVL
jgi:hypothetical protein